MKTFTYTVHIEKDSESGLYIGMIPSLPGAHTQAPDLETLHDNLKEVIQLCPEELSEEELMSAESRFVEISQISVQR